MKSVLCATLTNTKASVVNVEASFTRGLPGFSIVGLAQASIQESKERVKAALNSLGFTFPPSKIILNLSPSDLQKQGSHFDLSIALLIALQKENLDFKDFFVFGELGLDGTVKNTRSLFAIILSLAAFEKDKTFIVPFESLDELSMIPNIKLLGAKNLKDVISFFKDGILLESKQERELEAKKLKIGSRVYYYVDKYDLDFADVISQKVAKRASMIAAAGMHNIIYEGSPGCGKSMCANRIRYIMPPMSIDEVLDVAKKEILENSKSDFKPIRAFRSPHHTSTKASLFGGGSKTSKIGEVALAHNGVLFFDELPHFPTAILEALREPLQDNRVNISRVNEKVTYPTKFLFAAAMNPCPCGNLYSKEKSCRCNEVEIKRYRQKLSEPLLDRIDIFVYMSEFDSDTRDEKIDSKSLREQVLKAFKMQHSRGQKEFNAKMSEAEVREFCKLADEEEKLLRQAVKRFSLSNRGVDKVLKLSRTIADINENKNITKSDILEALSYRRRQ